jgi:hypothetical protein
MKDSQRKAIHAKRKESDLYKLMIKKYPNSSVGSDYHRWQKTGSTGNHGHFGEALREGRYTDAMYRADANNLVNLKGVGVEHFLSKKQTHPDDPSDYDHFISHYKWAKKHTGRNQ